MEDWVKIQTFDRMHQAELRKDILEKNDIVAVIVNERDSLFLIGEIELYVRTEDEKHARALIDEFNGLTKVNSFIMEKPMIMFKDILDRNEIYAVVKEKEDSRFVMENYEVYVRNEDVNKTIPFLTGEKLEGWELFDTQLRTRQTRFRIEILEEKGIDSLVIKKKDSNYHKEKIFIYVKNTDLVNAQKLITELNGWILIAHYPKLIYTEIREDLLGVNGIKSIIKENNEIFNLYVECSHEEKALQILNDHTNYQQVYSFNSMIEAEFNHSYLEENGIHAVLVNRQDSSFLMGEIDLYVDDFNVDDALRLINELKTLEK